jgi:hypothetical protein
VVEGVKQFRTQLNFAGLCHFEMLQQRYIEVQAARIIEEVSARIAERQSARGNEL